MKTLDKINNLLVQLDLVAAETDDGRCIEQLPCPVCHSPAGSCCVKSGKPMESRRGGPGYHAPRVDAALKWMNYRGLPRIWREELPRDVEMGLLDRRLTEILRTPLYKHAKKTGRVA